ncbi:glutaredoxin domain-containing protein [Leucobacter albus]|uniref:Glutaredoxin domain-containing protein n=1 Tax=Leucobacter albus TaxID=272210 RepID=A0ABW3TNB8_9MICO
MSETQQAESQQSETQGIRVFGADWCGDCRRAKRVFGEANVAYEWIDLVETPEAADVAEDISGRKNIPVITYPDGTHQVEPSDADMRAKLAELGLV